MVALLLTAVGFGIVWLSDSDADDPGRFRVAQIKDLCAAIDVAPLKELTPTEESSEGDSKPKAKPPRFTCEKRLLADKDASDYLAVTLAAEARVLDNIGDAEDAFAGAIDFEKSEGRKVTHPDGGGEQVAAVTVSDKADQPECRVHVRSSNAILSTTLFVTGPGIDCKTAPEILLTVSESTLDVMGSE